MIKPFSPPPSRIQLVQPWLPPVGEVVKQFVPTRAFAYTRRTGLAGTQPGFGASGQHEITERGFGVHFPATTPVVCGVIGIQPVTPHCRHGLVLLWGKTQLKWKPGTIRPAFKERAAAFAEDWWKGDASNEGWCTAVYPWTREQNGATLDKEMSSADSVQRMLDRCSDDVARSTAATALVSHADGSCERSWLVAEKSDENMRQVVVKARIASVMFLGQQIMDITVEFGDVDRKPE